MVYYMADMLVAGGGIGRIVGDGLIGVEHGCGKLVADFVKEGDHNPEVRLDKDAVVQAGRGSQLCLDPIYVRLLQTKSIDLVGGTPGDPLQLFGIGFGSAELAKPMLIGIIQRNSA